MFILLNKRSKNSEPQSYIVISNKVSNYNGSGADFNCFELNFSAIVNDDEYRLPDKTTQDEVRNVLNAININTNSEFFGKSFGEIFNIYLSSDGNFTVSPIITDIKLNVTLIPVDEFLYQDGDDAYLRTLKQSDFSNTIVEGKGAINPNHNIVFSLLVKSE